MRGLIALLCAGCSATDPCAGHKGTCVAVEVQGSGSVDQLDIDVSGVAQLQGKTPPQPGRAHALPVTTALFLPNVGGAVDVHVVGLLGGTGVGQAIATAVLRPGDHQTVILTLVALTGDLAVRDLHSGDLAGEDQSIAMDLGSDLSSSTDLTQADLTQADLTAFDMIPLAPRYMFLLPARASDFGAIGPLDTECTTTAAGAGLPSVAYRALVAYSGSEPASHITLGQGRDIKLPSGTKVSTDATFWSGTHLHGIDQLANGTVAASGCAWSNFGASGSRIPVANDCQSWTVVNHVDNGAAGDITATDTQWSFSTIDFCDVKTCYIYCIQQD